MRYRKVGGVSHSWTTWCPGKVSVDAAETQGGGGECRE